MGLNRDKFRKIVGGITTSELEEATAAETAKPEAGIVAMQKEQQPAAGQGGDDADQAESADQAKDGGSRRFAKRGRPKGRKEEGPAGKIRKVKVSLFLSEFLVNDFYDWAHADKIHPGEMFERALKPFHNKETKRRNGGKE